jgi:hypothetical protein
MAGSTGQVWQLCRLGKSKPLLKWLSGLLPVVLLVSPLLIAERAELLQSKATSLSIQYG